MLRLYVVEREEYSGQECDGHWQTYIVAAENAVEASGLVPQDILCGQNIVRILILPNLERIRKARIVA